MVGLENAANQTDDNEGSDCYEVLSKLGTDSYPAEKVFLQLIMFSENCLEPHYERVSRFAELYIS